MTRTYGVGLAGLFALIPALALGQGTVAGRIEDALGGRPLADAEVTIRGTSLRTLTDPEGRYRLPEAPTGTWVVEIRRVGYRAVAVADVVVRLGRITTVNHPLEPLPLELATVTVTPAFFPGSAAEPLSRVEYSGEEIRRAPGTGGDVSRIMQALPSVAKVNDQSNGLIVRGGSPMENLILIDGIEVPNLNHFPVQGSSGGPIGLLNVDLVQGMELSSGGFGAPYGNRLSSVVDIRLREGNRREFDAQLDLNFVGYGGVLEGPLGGGRGAWLVSARRSYLDLVIKAFETGTTIVPSYGDFQAKLSWDLSPAHRLGLVALGADDAIESDLAIARDNDMLAFGAQDLLQATTGLTWAAFWGERVQSQSSLAVGVNRFDEDYFETASGGLPILRNRSRETTLRLRHGTDVRLTPRLALGVGGDAAHTWYRFDQVHGERIGPFGDPVGALDARGSLAETRLGGHATLSAQLRSTVTLSPGVRVDHASPAGATVVSPRVALVWHASPRTAASLAGGLYHQGLPAVLLAQQAEYQALPDARAFHLVAGVNHLLRDDLRFSIEAYHKRADRLPVDPDVPELLPADELYQGFGFLTAPGTLVPDGRSHSTGVEVVLHQKLSRRVYGLAGASVFRSNYDAADGIRRNRVFDNRVLVSIESGVKAGRGWDISARWLFGGGTPYTPLDLPASAAANRTILDRSRVNGERLPHYHSLNLRVDRAWQVGRSTVRSFVSAWNVYGRENVAQYFWNDRTGRQEAISQWGLLPVFGLEWEFD